MNLDKILEGEFQPTGINPINVLDTIAQWGSLCFLMEDKTERSFTLVKYASAETQAVEFKTKIPWGNAIRLIKMLDLSEFRSATINSKANWWRTADRDKLLEIIKQSYK